jgi:DNA-binding CsgD family transcriptional regulator
MDTWTTKPSTGRNRLHGMIWSPLLIEGLIGSGRCDQAAIERLRQASELYGRCGAGPLMVQTEGEPAACGLPRPTVQRRSVLELTSRESEVAHLVNERMTNAEIAAELFITPKAVEYHPGNIYAKFGPKGRQQLRRFLGEARRPTLV